MYTYQDCSLSAFQEPITALDNQPVMDPGELKRRFQAPADEVRQAHNDLCRQVEALSGIVNGLIAQTFTGAVDESMLDEVLTQKINGKADSTSLEQSNEQIAQLFDALDEKSGVLAGKYIGDGATQRTIELGVQPTAVLVMQDGIRMYVNGIGYGALAVTGSSAYGYMTLTEKGFSINMTSTKCALNVSNSVYNYIAVY